MTNEERELVEMMADAKCHKGQSYFEIARAMLSVVKANIGKIAETCPACWDAGIRDACEICHGSGVVKKGE